MIDWDSSKTEILFNPRIPQEERDNYRDFLKGQSFSSHVWLTTSGTTNRYKFIALSKNAILTSARAVNQHLESSKHDTWLHCLPDFHVGGLGIWARASISGAQVVKLHKWCPEKFRQRVVDSKATLTALVPTQVFDLVSKNLKAPEYLRGTIVGGGSLSETFYIRGCALGWNLLPSYGLTECASQVATAFHGHFDQLSILPHISIKIASNDFLCECIRNVIITH